MQSKQPYKLSKEDEEEVYSLLQSSREKLSNGLPQAALESVIEAIRMSSGEDAILKLLDMAKEKARKELESGQPPSQQSRPNIMTKAEEREMLKEARKACDNLINQPSLLAEKGDDSEYILQAAFEDGSSLICKRCQGLVSRQRWAAHCEYWCPEIDS